MNTEDKIYQKIQQASEKLPNDSFPGMDKVWSRVEEKLDTNVLKKENNRWKKISVAAAVVVVGTLVFHFLQPENTTTTTNETIVTLDTLQPILAEPEDAIVATEKLIIKEDKETILQKAVEKPTLVMAEEIIINKNQEPVVSESVTQGFYNAKEISAAADDLENKAVSSFAPTTKAKKSETYSNFIASDTDDVGKKLPPLVVIDGKASKTSDMKNIPSDLEAIVILNDPIYIINGVMYTEEELFGPNPTSPYAPLQKQDIISTTILQEEDALKAYGEKGKKGVVIIKTKDGKPKK
jgi:hypothetical protein